MDKELKKVKSDIEKCEDEIKIAETNVFQSTGEDKKYWMMKEIALRAKKTVLRATESALMAEKKPINEVSIPKYSKGI